MQAARFGRVITAMVTPFKRNSGEIDLAKATKLAEYLLANGSDGLVLAGTTGESPVLNREQEIEFFHSVADTVQGKGTLIFNIGTNNTRENVEFAKRVVKDFSPDGLMAVNPYYNCPPQEGQYQHFQAIAEAACSCPLIIYNVPGRTGGNISAETTLHLAHDVKNIVAIKEASGNLEQITEIIAGAPKDFEVISGEDILNFEIAKLGGTSCISVASHIVGCAIKQMYIEMENDNFNNAEKINNELKPIYSALFMSGTKSPMMIKDALNIIGHNVGNCELPLVGPTPEQHEEMRRAIVNCKYVDSF